MNLEEFRKALSSDATEENAQLKRQLSDLQTEYHEKLSKLENENDSLKESCRVLCNRCFTLTRGVTCLFCGLDYPCPHMPGLEEQVAMAQQCFISETAAKYRVKKMQKLCGAYNREELTELIRNIL